MKKILNFYFPYLINILIFINSILKNKGIPYLYVVVIFISITIMILTGIKKNKNKNLIYVFLYLLSLIVVFTIQFFIYNDVLRSLKSLLMYITIIVYWIIYFNKFSSSDFRELLIKLIPWFYIIAIIGIIQYFVSPTLFGYIPESKNMLWASKTSFDSYSRYFRVTSILGSPQVFGLFMALSIIIIISMKKYSNFLLLGVVVFSGLLSGNKSFFLIMLLYVLYKLFFVNIGNMLKIILIIFTVIFSLFIIFPKNISNIEAINRVVDVNKIEKQEKNDSRLKRYYNIVYSSNPFIGNGLGTKTDKKFENFVVAESYIFQILGEGGFFVLFFFFLFYINSYLNLNRKIFYDIKYLSIAIFFSMIFVHAFGSPIFFLFWGVLISPYTNEFNNCLKGG